MQLLGINFLKSTYKECLALIEGKLIEGKKLLVVTPNPEMCYDAVHDEELMNILRRADIATPDGAGIFVAYQIQNSRLPRWIKYLVLPWWCLRAVAHSNKFKEEFGERITGADLTRDLLSFASMNKISVVIIDPAVNGNSTRDEAKRASQGAMKAILEKKFPGLECHVIVGDEAQEILSSKSTGLTGLNTINASIVFATHGGGKQEKILAETIEKSSGVIGIGVGGSIDLLTGFRAGAPEWMRSLGLEWLYRLMKQPKRHIKRMEKVGKFLHHCIK